MYNKRVNRILKTALFNSLATTAYIVAIASFMFYAGETKLGVNNTFLAPIAMLLLFVFSAALTGFLIFGRPALMFLDGKKKEAMTLLTYTLAIFSVITLFAIILLIIFSA